MVDLWICGYLLLVCAAIRALKGWWAIECRAWKSCGSCGVVDVASLYAWELKLYFYPSAGGKKKKKKSLYASAALELSGCMIFGLLIVRASC